MLSDFLLQTSPETIELTFSPGVAEFIARFLHCLLFHTVGITLCLASSFVVSPGK